MSYSNLTEFMHTTPSWDIAKEAFLQKMKLRIVEPPNADYAIVRYVKDQSDFTDSAVPEFRSIVIHKPTNKVVCVAPPKSKPYNTENVENKVVHAQEFIDGTMLNIFRDVDGIIKVSSRSRIGVAKTKFSEMTFQEMVNDALSITPIKHYSELIPEGWSSVSIIFNHIQNRIVCPVVLPKVYIVSMSKIANDGTITTIYNDYPESHSIYAVPSYDLNAVGQTIESINQYVLMKSLAQKHAWQGIVLYTDTGDRVKIRNSFYLSVKILRGNDVSMEDRYSRLRRGKNIKQYLDYFPEDKDIFYEMENRLRNNTKKLYELYVKTNITHEIKYEDLGWPFKFHVSVLRRRYKELLKEMKEKVSLAYVITYVNNLSDEDGANILKAPLS